jgi:PTS system cellobiose-specific IIC component
MVMSAVMYYPFLKAYERTLLRQDEERSTRENESPIAAS